MRTLTMPTVTVLLAIMLFAASVPAALAQDGSGTLDLYANGEDFVRQGFTSKDGWAITFDTLTVSLADMTAYQSDPPYDPHDGGDIVAATSVLLAERAVVDLAAGDADADPILVATVEDAPAGQYNAIAWRMLPADDTADDADDSESDADDAEADSAPTLLMQGHAVKDETTIAFTIAIDSVYEYRCGEYVGDTRKGILDAGDVADLEMTFHFDHIFGDGDLPLDDSLNEHAPGFDVFAALAQDGVLDTDRVALEAALEPDDYALLVDILPTLGHVGEGHCHATTLAPDDADAADDASTGD